MINVLFVHQAGLAQFRNLAITLSKSSDYSVYSLRAARVPLKFPSVNLDKDSNIFEINYPFLRANTSNHILTKEVDSKLIRADSVYKALSYLIANDLVPKPDIIWAHPGWGETLFLRQLFPDVPQVHFAEYYYSVDGQDVDPSHLSVDEILKVNVKNIHNSQSAVDCDLMISPTRWQASTYPSIFQSKIKVIHDGIDIESVISHTSLELDQSLSGLPTQSHRPIVVYTNRAMEPIRGSDTFVNALNDIIELPPEADVCIVGGQNDQNPYGGVNDNYLKHVRTSNLIAKHPDDIFHFPRLSQVALHQLWGISSCNIYLTAPFVLSWSLLEMMCLSTPIVASSTAPVLDYLDKFSSILVDYTSSDSLVNGISKALELPPSKIKSFSRKNLRTLKNKADLYSFSLKQQLKVINRLVSSSS